MLKEQRRQLVEDEKRLRDNLSAVGHDTTLYKQTLDKLGETEATIGTLSTAIGKGTAEIETAREQLTRISHTGVFLGGNLCGGWSSGVKKAAVVG